MDRETIKANADASFEAHVQSVRDYVRVLEADTIEQVIAGERDLMIALTRALPIGLDGRDGPGMHCIRQAQSGLVTALEANYYRGEAYGKVDRGAIEEIRRQTDFLVERAEADYGLFVGRLEQGCKYLTEERYLLNSLVQDLRFVTHDVGYFCRSLQCACNRCPYGNVHGPCGEQGSDWERIEAAWGELYSAIGMHCR